MSVIDYETKYKNLKAKYLNTVDLAWRLGYEEGLKEAQTDQAQQMAQMAQMPQEEDNQESEAQEAETQEAAEQNAAPQEDELGKHIEKLEGMLGKSEFSGVDVVELKKTLNDIRSLQTSINLIKSMENAKNSKMVKSLDFKLSPKLIKNVSDSGKKALTLQHKIVENVFSKWEKDSKKTGNEIVDLLNISGLTKK